MREARVADEHVVQNINLNRLQYESMSSEKTIRLDKINIANDVLSGFDQHACGFVGDFGRVNMRPRREHRIQVDDDQADSTDESEGGSQDGRSSRLNNRQP